jgi:hypothetical protein
LTLTENKKLLVPVLTVLFAAAMAACAGALREPEILFPEAAALCAGAWMAPRQPWRVTRVQMPLLMTASAVGGVLIVRCLPAPLPVQTAAGLLYTAALLAVSGSTLIPLISACILPIFLKTEAWVYPVAVLALSSCIALGQLLLNKWGLRQDSPQSPARPFCQRLRRWGFMAALLFAFCLVPTAVKRVYFCAPPLLVTFAELMAPESRLRQKPVKIWLLLTGAAAAGLLPLILPEAGIMLYVPLLSLGAAAITAFSCLYYKNKQQNSAEFTCGNR